MIKITYTDDIKNISINNSERNIYNFIPRFDLEKETFDFLHQLEKQEVQELKFTDLYYYDDIPLYFFIRPTLFLKIKDVLEIVIIFSSILETLTAEEWKNIIVETDNVLVKEIVIEVFGLDVSFVIKKIEKVKKNHKIDTRSLIKIWRNGIKTFIEFKSKSINGKNMMIMSQSASINSMTTNGQIYLYDSQYGMLLKDLESEYNVINIEYLNSKANIEKANAMGNKFLPFAFFVMYKRLKWKRLFELALEIDNTSLIYKFIYSYKKYDLKNIILKYCLNDFKHYIISYVKEICCAKSFLKSLNIDKFITIDEGDRARCFVVAANKLNIKTYAIQHGIIGATSPAYIINHNKGRQLVPYKTFLWGEKFKKILLGNHSVYNENNLAIVGQMRTDCLIKNYKTKNNCSQDGNIKILYATQYIEDLTKPATKMLLEAIKKMDENISLVIKLHPLDIFKDYYNELVKEYDLNNIEIVKEGDIYSFIDWSDVVVSVHSTVVVEGALFNKPSICMLLPKYYDEGNFVRDGLSIGVENSDELKAAIKNVTSTNVKINEEYIRDNFYLLDGKAHERAMEHIRGGMTNE